jgi:site-specific recombinase XerC
MINLTVSAALDQFLSDPRRKLITRKKYLYKLRPFLDQYGACQLTSITADHILQWFHRMEASGSAEATLAMIRSCLVAFLNHCVATGWLESNPAKVLPRYDGRPKRVITADPDHVAQALTICGFLAKSRDATNRRDAAVFALAAISGGRRSNIMLMPFRETLSALEHPVLDAGVGNIYTVATRGKTPIEIVFGEWHAQILRGWLELRPESPHNRLFVHTRVTSLGEPLEANGLGHARRHICKAAGVPTITFQQLRKLKGTQIARRYGLELAASALGHISGTRVIREHYYDPDKHAARVAILQTGKS